MNRAALHFAAFTAALTGGAAFWFAEPGSTDSAGDGLKEKPAARSVDHWQAYRRGHDWLETALPTKRENRLADNAARFRLPSPGSVDCAEPGCRVCQWNRLFGGEW